MKKLSILLAVAALFGALTLAACTTEPAEDPATEAPTTAETDAPTAAPTEAPTETQTEPAAEITYTVTVKDQDGNPVAGVRVQMCKDELCMLPKSTGDDGVATFSETEDTYHAKLASLPEGYTAEMNEKGTDYAYHDFGDATDITITITKG